ncbi:hypothetical protein SCUP515_06907 [Seiridium cupressi]
MATQYSSIPNYIVWSYLTSAERTYPERVKSLVLRGVSTMRVAELVHSRRGPNGAAKFYPEMYEQFIGLLPADERKDPIAAYYKRLTSEDEEVLFSAAREWNRWDLTMGYLRYAPDAYARLDDAPWSVTHAKLEAHYFAHAAFLEEGQLLSGPNIDKMKHIPGDFASSNVFRISSSVFENHLTAPSVGAIVQGRYDLTTPPQIAWELHITWLNSTVYPIGAAGHSATRAVGAANTNKAGRSL